MVQIRMQSGTLKLNTIIDFSWKKIFNNFFKSEIFKAWNVNLIFEC